MKQLQEAIDIIYEATTEKDAGDVINIFTTMVISTALNKGIEKEDLKEYLEEAIDATYKQFEVPSGTSLH